MYKGKVVSVNISENKGVVKAPVKKIILNKKGIKKDAHAGKWNRQVSLLSSEQIIAFQKKLKREIAFGEFAENITTQNIDLKHAKPLDKLKIGDCKLEVTQIGKKCHGTNCAIFQEVGDCIMPSDGIFARVRKTGEIKPGDDIVLKKRTFKIKVVTLSDRASKGVYEDKSGKLIMNLLNKFFEQEGRKLKVNYQLIPDSASQLQKSLNSAVESKFDMVITTGGTGIGPRDITPDIVQQFVDKEIPGIMDHIRIKYGENKPQALISRSYAGVKNQTIFFALPGNTKAVKEYFDELKLHFFHLLYMLHELDLH